MVEVEDLGKRFKIFPHPLDRAVEYATLGKVRRHSDFWALRGVSFSVDRGECFGIIGPNGSGKSTLLKLLTGALFATEGRFAINVPVKYSLLELGTGFHPDLTGRENIFQSATLQALPASYLTPDVVEQIREFADIGDFFDRPFRFYSSGMQVRLGFAMVACMKPDLLIVDEALSVGDIFFQQKCTARIDSMREEGVTFLFVSHDNTAVRKLCRRVLLLHEGHPVFLGPSEEGINRYWGLVTKLQPTPAAALATPAAPRAEAGMTAPEVRGGNILRDEGRRHGERDLEIVAARVTSAAGHDTLSVGLKETLNLDLLLLARAAIHNPSAGVFLFDRFGNLVFSAGTTLRGHRLPALQAGEGMVVRLNVRFNVQPGLYTFTLGASEAGHATDRHESLGPIHVVHEGGGPLPFHGIVELPMECQHSEVVPLAEPEEGLIRRGGTTAGVL